MARKRKSTKSRRRSFKAPARRRRAAPRRASTSRRSRAVGRRRRVKRNPMGFLSQPAVQYGIAATVGAGVGMALNNRHDLIVGGGNGRQGYSAALVAAAVVLLGSHFGLKGRKKQLGYAAGIGLLLPSVGGYISDGVNALIPPKTTTETVSSRAAGAYLPRGSRSLPPYKKGSSAKRKAVAKSTSRMKSA